MNLMFKITSKLGLAAALTTLFATAANAACSTWNVRLDDLCACQCHSSDLKVVYLAATDKNLTKTTYLKTDGSTNIQICDDEIVYIDYAVLGNRTSQYRTSYFRNGILQKSNDHTIRDLRGRGAGSITLNEQGFGDPNQKY